jgi:hypothetical protein
MNRIRRAGVGVVTIFVLTATSAGSAVAAAPHTEATLAASCRVLATLPP